MNMCKLNDFKNLKSININKIRINSEKGSSIDAICQLDDTPFFDANIV